MSHYPTIRGDGLLDINAGICAPARRWHESFATIAKDRNLEIIWSLSFELLDQQCPGVWKQRNLRGEPALTAYSPPSTLLSPANADAMGYLARIANELLSLASAVGMSPHFQIGEPWWWVDADDAPCIYDDEAQKHWPANHVAIGTVSAPITASGRQVLDRAGELLAEATASLMQSVRSQHPATTTHLLAYLPSIMRNDAPDLVRMNLPEGWSAPAFDRLQLEDYEWVTDGNGVYRRGRLENARERLRYSRDTVQYLAGFAARETRARDWAHIVDAADAASSGGLERVFLWALPQVIRDGITFFESTDEMDAFRDVEFPIEIGLKASVSPTF